MDATDEDVDFVIVGSGAGGGPLAARLALDGFRVLVLEAGDDHACPYYSVPIMQAYASEDPAMRWDFFVRHWGADEIQSRDPKFVPARDGVLYPRGSTVGGSTAVSAMVTMYPPAGDWRRLAESTGDPSWGPEAMHGLVRRLEAWRGADAQPLPGMDEADRDRLAGHGRTGWLGTTRAAPSLAGREPRFLDIIGAIEQTARTMFDIPQEVSLPRDINAQDTPDGFQGMTFVPVAVRDGRRNGSRERLQDVARQHPDRLTIRTGCLVTRVVLEGTTAVGVEYLVGRRAYRAAPAGSECTAGAATGPADPGGAVRTVRARREVILAGGTFNTPQLLMLSGLGPASELARLGIEPVRDLPGVGANLHDRYEVSVVGELDDDYPIFVGAALDIPADGEPADDLYTQWRDDADGPYTTNGSLAAIVARSGVAGPESDLVVFALPIDFRGYYPGYAKDAVREHDRLSIVVLKAHTTNRAGTVRLRSTDPRDVPAIDFRYFEEGSGDAEADLRGVVDGIGIARSILSRVPGVRRELVPGEDVTGEEGLASFVREQSWGHHACGTARIGRADDPLAVVDGDFRVHGIDRLRVVDASVFPDIPGLFIASAVYLISEKAADVIAAAHSTG